MIFDSKITYTFLTEDRQTYSSRLVNVRVEEIWRELAYRRFGRIVFTEMDCKRIVASLPISLLIKIISPPYSSIIYQRT